MQTLLRISLLCLFAAGGITVAIALAVNKPPPAKEPLSAQPVLSAASPVTQTVPVVAPYRDPVANQISQLDETIDRARESSTHQSQSLLQAITNLAHQIGQAHVQAEEPPQQPAPGPAAVQAVPEQ